jgi:GAF domain-containing protein
VGIICGMSPLDPDRIAAAHRVAATAVGSPGLQRLTDLAATLLGVPAAQVAVVGERHSVAAASGRPAWGVGTEYVPEQTLGGVTVALRAPLVVSDARTDPRVAGLPPVLAGEIGCYLGVPLSAPDRGHVIGVLAVFGPEPRSWTEGDVVLLSQLGTPVASELELAALSAEFEASRLRWGLAIDAAGVGSFDWDLVSGRLSWDDRMLELFGWSRAEFPGVIAAFRSRLHPDDAERVE